MALQIRTKRIERKMTMQELADRVNISRGLLSRIEKGDPNCAIGVVFEVASILDIRLFHSDYSDLMLHNKLITDKLTLLPSVVRAKSVKIDNDF